jgi:hypothetical protein
MKHFILVFALLSTAGAGRAQFQVSGNHHFLLKDGKPFYWLGDTGWELLHRLNRHDAERYFKRRSEQGFTVIQTVVLAETDGLHTPNANGDLPLIQDDPLKPNEPYFRYLDTIIDLADQYHINIALLPTWGDKVFRDRWGIGPEIFTKENATGYASWLARRYKNKTNIIWILGGDRNPRNQHDADIWRAMGRAIKQATDQKAVISFHPQPNETGSAEWFQQDDWLDFNMFQNGHCRDMAVYDKIQHDYNLAPARPVLDGESLYEDHPVCFNAHDLGISSAYDVRQYAYLDVFAGAFGNTYGCHDVWQMYSPRFESVNGAHLFWQQAIELPGAIQMGYLRKLMESENLLDRIPDQSIIEENDLPASERIQATRGKDYAFIYTAQGKPITVLLWKLNMPKLSAQWFDPRTGKFLPDIKIRSTEKQRFDPPDSGYGQDWVLVLREEKKISQ